MNNLIALNSRFIVIFLANIDFKKCLMESVLRKNSKNDKQCTPFLDAYFNISEIGMHLTIDKILQSLEGR